MNGKKKCRLLKQIRIRTAEANQIPFETSECGYEGDCRGTCPKCEAELEYLNRQLELRKKAGRAVAAAVLSAGILLSSGCVPDALTGDIPMPSDDPGASEEAFLTGESEEMWSEQTETETEPEQEETLTGDIAYDDPDT